MTNNSLSYYLFLGLLHSTTQCENGSHVNCGLSLSQLCLLKGDFSVATFCACEHVWLLHAFRGIPRLQCVVGLPFVFPSTPLLRTEVLLLINCTGLTSTGHIYWLKVLLFLTVKVVDVENLFLYYLVIL